MDHIELLASPSVASAVRLGDPWETWNLVVESVSGPPDPHVVFQRADSARPGNLVQRCATPRLDPYDRFVVAVELRASGGGAAGLNVYLHPDAAEEAPHQVFQLAHPGDGDWHVLTREIPIPEPRPDHVRLMIVLRAGEAPIAVRTLSLRRERAATAPAPDLDALHITPAYHAAVRDLVDRHPASGDPVFRDHLFRSLIGGNRKGIRTVQAIADRLRGAGKNIAGGRFLDLGCGTGGALVGARRLGAAWCEGWEINAEKRALARLNLSSLFGEDAVTAVRDMNMEDTDATAPPFEPYGLVFCEEVLEHVKDLDAALATLARCIDPDCGAAHVTIPAGYALAHVLRDPHLQLFGITLLDRFEAQPIATALKNHTHYAAMMGAYHPWSVYLAIFARHGLACIPVEPPDVSNRAIRAAANQLAEIRKQREALVDAWSARVDSATIALVAERVDGYVAGAETALEQARAAASDAPERRQFVEDYATSHIDLIVAPAGSPVLAR
ncbi:MAG: methyltransferase domain-containing protein [Candidatus Hydrogenedentes bacterium]|nr:methyltransferase domain-containing protein [Candidatus Hydrogenedentota bacterium]